MTNTGEEKDTRSIAQQALAEVGGPIEAMAGEYLAASQETSKVTATLKPEPMQRHNPSYPHSKTAVRLVEKAVEVITTSTAMLCT